MTGEGAVLAGRIRAELLEIGTIVDRAMRAWAKCQAQDDDLYLDGVALNIHAFYSCVERIFERIGNSVDRTVPKGVNWHRELLDQMSIEVRGVRPAVISRELKERLNEYLGFRHVVRNVYSYRLNPVKMEGLLEGVGGVNARLREELDLFAEFLLTAC